MDFFTQVSNLILQSTLSENGIIKRHSFFLTMAFRNDNIYEIALWEAALIVAVPKSGLLIIC